MKRLSLILSIFAAGWVVWDVTDDSRVLESLGLSAAFFNWCIVGTGVVCFIILTVGLERGKSDNKTWVTGKRRLFTLLMVASLVSYVMLKLFFPWRHRLATLCCFAIMVTTVGYFLFGTAEGRADLGQALQSMKKNWYIARLVCVVLAVLGSSMASHAYFRSRVESVTMSEEGLGFEDWEHILSSAQFKDLHFIVHPVSAEGMTFYFAKGAGRKERVQEIVSTLNQKRQAIGP